MISAFAVNVIVLNAEVSPVSGVTAMNCGGNTSQLYVAAAKLTPSSATTAPFVTFNVCLPTPRRASEVIVSCFLSSDNATVKPLPMVWPDRVMPVVGNCLIATEEVIVTTEKAGGLELLTGTTPVNW